MKNDINIKMKKSIIKTATKDRILTKDNSLIIKKRKLFIAPVLISLSIVFLIAGLIFVDIFIFDSKVNKKAVIVEQKINDLQNYVENKLPTINEASLIQEEQLNQLKNISKNK